MEESESAWCDLMFFGLELEHFSDPCRPVDFGPKPDTDPRFRGDMPPRLHLRSLIAAACTMDRLPSSQGNQVLTGSTPGAALQAPPVLHSIFSQ